MDLESVVQNEVRKRKTNIIYQCTYVETRKMVLMNLFAGEREGHGHREWTCGHGGGKEGWDELGDED